MPFLNWFKRKTENTDLEAQPVPAEKSTSISADVPEPIAPPPRQESEPGAKRDGPGDFQLPPLNLFGDSEPAKNDTRRSSGGVRIFPWQSEHFIRNCPHICWHRKPRICRELSKSQKMTFCSMKKPRRRHSLSQFSVCPVLKYLFARWMGRTMFQSHSM